jgi:hypothetical protein
MVQGLDPVEAEEALQDHLLARPEAREMRLGPGGIDRQNGEVFGRGRGVCEPLNERSRPVVLVSIQRDHAQRVPSRLASVRPEPAPVEGRCRGHGPPDSQKARTPSDGASRRPPAKPAHRPLHDGSQVGGEAGAPRRVEPLDGHDHGEGARLDPILERHVPRRDPAGERHDEPVQGLDQRVPGPKPALARHAGRHEAGPVDHPIELPDEPRRAKRQRGEVGGERRHRLRRLRARLPRASHPIVPGTEARAESSGSRRSDQEAPADGRRDLPAVDPRIPVLKARLLDAPDPCRRFYERDTRLGQLGDQRGLGHRVEPPPKARHGLSLATQPSGARRFWREPCASGHRKPRQG